MQTLFWLAFQIVIIFQFKQTVDCVLISRLTGTSRIVNGKEADINQFPYILSLRRNAIHRCGASVLSHIWAISAAYCIYGYERSPHLFSLRAGSRMRSTGGVIVRVTQIFRHPLYNPETENYDVSLLRTQPIVLRGSLISSIKLPKVNDDLPENTAAIVSGWGQLSSSETTSSRVLKYTSVYIFNQEECRRSLKDHGTVTDAYVYNIGRASRWFVCKIAFFLPLLQFDEKKRKTVSMKK